MKKYNFELKGRQRVMGYSTGDSDVSISSFHGDEIVGEENHYHTDSDEIMIVVKGEGVLQVDEREVDLKPGCLIRIEKGEKHRVLKVTKAPIEYYVIKVPDNKDDKVIV